MNIFNLHVSPSYEWNVQENAVFKLTTWYPSLQTLNNNELINSFQTSTTAIDINTLNPLSYSIQLISNIAVVPQTHDTTSFTIKIDL